MQVRKKLAIILSESTIITQNLAKTIANNILIHVTKNLITYWFNWSLLAASIFTGITWQATEELRIIYQEPAHMENMLLHPKFAGDLEQTVVEVDYFW